MFLLVSLSEVVYFYLRKLAIDILKTHYKKLYKTILHKEFKNGLILLAHFVNVLFFNDLNLKCQIELLFLC